MEALSAQIDSVSSGETLISYAINQCAKVQTNVHLPFLVWAAPIKVCVCMFGKQSTDAEGQPDFNTVKQARMVKRTNTKQAWNASFPK